jgi:hypothetical protein
MNNSGNRIRRGRRILFAYYDPQTIMTLCQKSAANAAALASTYAFHTWPSEVFIPAMALRVSTMHFAQSAKS